MQKKPEQDNSSQTQPEPSPAPRPIVISLKKRKYFDWEALCKNERTDRMNYHIASGDDDQSSLHRGQL